MDEDIAPAAAEDNMNAPDSTSSGPSTSNSSQSSQVLDHKYTTKPGFIGPVNDESLLDKIFNKVAQDLKASGITGTYP